LQPGAAARAAATIAIAAETPARGDRDVESLEIGVLSFRKRRVETRTTGRYRLQRRRVGPAAEPACRAACSAILVLTSFRTRVAGKGLSASKRMVPLLVS